MAFAHIHVDIEVMLYILEGAVRHEYGPALEHKADNVAGDFIFIEPGVAREVCNLSTMARKFGLASLTHLDLLPATGAVVIAAPLKIVGGSGSPLRVLAIAPA